MKLIELVKDHPWPDGAAVCAQDNDGTVFWFESSAIKFGGGVWSQLTDEHDAIDFYDFGHLVDDYQMDVVTHADWLAAQEPVEPKEREPGFYFVVSDDYDEVVAMWDGSRWRLGSQRIEPLKVYDHRIERQP